MAAAKPQSQREGPEKTNFFTKLIRPLRDFGLGKSSLWEGGVGLFIFAGIGKPEILYVSAERLPDSVSAQTASAGFALMLITWARGGQLGRKGKGYQVNLHAALHRHLCLSRK